MPSLARAAALLSLAASVVAADPVRAQAADSSAIRAAVWTACPGGELRLATRTEGIIRGRCGGVRDGRLFVGLYADERMVNLAEIDTVWVRRRATLRGAATGGVAGGVGMGLLGLSVATAWCPSGGCARETVFIARVSTLAGVVGGALLGAAVGHNVRFWDRRHPR